MAKKAPQPLEMFGGGNDLPLLSGTAQRVVIKEFKPAEQVKQPSMFAVTCPVCFGTRQVKPKGKSKAIPCMFCT